MFQLSSLAKHRLNNVLRSSLLVLALTLSYTGTASATLWSNGDVITFGQGSWGAAPSPGNAAKLLQDNFGVVYPSGQLEVGVPGSGGFSMLWSNVTDLLSYLPALGTSGPLNGDLLDATSSSAGAFGGDITALRLNIDFSDAGVTLGTSGLHFGDLTLHDFSTLPSLNGLTVRQFQDMVNTLLGGGSSIYTIAELELTLALLDQSFGGGQATGFALDHLNAPEVTHPTPEPTSFALMLLGLAGLKLVRRGKRIGCRGAIHCARFLHAGRRGRDKSRPLRRPRFALRRHSRARGNPGEGGSRSDDLVGAQHAAPVRHSKVNIRHESLGRACAAGRNGNEPRNSRKARNSGNPSRVVRAFRG